MITKNFLQKSIKRSLIKISDLEHDTSMLKIDPISDFSKCQFRSQSTSGTSLPSLLNKMLKPNQVNISTYYPISDIETGIFCLKFYDIVLSYSVIRL